MQSLYGLRSVCQRKHTDRGQCVLCPGDGESPGFGEGRRARLHSGDGG